LIIHRINAVQCKIYTFHPSPLNTSKLLEPDLLIIFSKLERLKLFTNIPEIRNGIVVPKEKVDYLILSSGNRPKITLKQPYYIGSIRLEIDNQNSNRKYKFLIETSLNQRDWEKVADKSDEFVNGWQTFRFTSKPISLVRFIPTACNTDVALDTFRSKNFECPSSV